MDYYSNKVLDILQRNTVLHQVMSKTTKSCYFFWKYTSFRYSDHRTTNDKLGRYFIIYTYDHPGFWMRRYDEDEYTWYTEIQLAAFLRRLEKKEHRYKEDKQTGHKRTKRRIMTRILNERKNKRRRDKELYEIRLNLLGTITKEQLEELD